MGVLPVITCSFLFVLTFYFIYVCRFAICIGYFVLRTWWVLCQLRCLIALLFCSFLWDVAAWVVWFSVCIQPHWVFCGCFGLLGLCLLVLL